MADSLDDLSQAVKQFAVERDWQQFHSPKNLATALIVEAGELLEHFQWLSQEQSLTLSPDQRDQVASEVADVLIYLIQLSAALDIDPVGAARQKLKVNAERYPVERARGTSKKYDQL